MMIPSRADSPPTTAAVLKPDGSISGNDNDADRSRFEPHYTEISEPGQVQIYEPIMADSQGKVTTGLLSAVRYVKDNRILPNGFDNLLLNFSTQPCRSSPSTLLEFDSLT